MIEKKPYIITVCSGKGGVGKSVLTANIAFKLAQLYKVLIWDADSYFPNQHFLMGVEPPVRLKDVFEGKTDINTAIFRLSENLCLLSDRPSSLMGMAAKKYSMEKLMNELKINPEFDFVLLDTPAGYTYEALESCSIADLICIVITDEPTSLIDAYGLIKIIMPYIETEKIKLLVNNVIDYEDAEDISVKLNLATNNFLNVKLEVLGFVPYDRIVRQSILKQELFTKIFSDSDASKSIENISRNLIKNVFMSNDS